MGRKSKSVANAGQVFGNYAIYRVDEKTGLWTRLFDKDNLIMYSWGALITKTLGALSSSYQVAAAYLEFQNVPEPGNPVAVPSYTRAAGLSYFSALPSDTDFLRVPLVGPPTIDTTPDFTAYIPAGSGNRVTYTTQSSGTVGFNGVPFSDGNNSTIYGITLVATPTPSDQTHDVILSRGYFNVADQQLKLLGSQVGVSWGIAFK